MLLTPEEAKTRTCPETFVVPEIPSYREGGPFNCLATDCMAWRWDGAIANPEHHHNQNKPFWNAAKGWLTMAEARGYCGKAGKP